MTSTAAARLTGSGVAMRVSRVRSRSTRRIASSWIRSKRGRRLAPDHPEPA